MRCEKLSLLADIQTGPFGSQLHKEDYVTIGTPIVTVEHLGNKYFTKQNLPFVSDGDKQRLKKYLLKVGDIVFSRVGAVDRCSFVSSEYDEWLFSGRCLRIRPNNGLNSEYLYYYFCLEEIKQFIRNIATGATMPSINTKFMGEVPVKFPAIETQCRIASVLSVIDDKIELNNLINKNLEEQAQAIFKSWFIDFKNHKRVICRADEFFDISIGKTPPRKEKEWFSTDNSDVKWVSISDMGNCGMYINNSSEYLTRQAIEKFNIKVVPQNTVLLSFKLTVGRVAITNDNMATNEAIAHFKTDKEYIIEYLYFYLKNYNFQSLGSTSSIATAVNSKIIKSMPFVIPAIDEITRFHEMTSSLFAEIKKNQEENQRLSALRDTLLPKLMSGEIDVSNL